MDGENVMTTLNVCAVGTERMLDARAILRRCDGSQKSNRSQVAVKRLTLLS